MRTRGPVARAVRNIRQGRMQRTLAAATAASTVPLTF